MHECNGEIRVAQNDGLARQAFLGMCQRTATLVRSAPTPARGLESGAELEGDAEFSTRTTRAGISPARAQSPQGIVARTASPAE
jgi:hypothetical protein